MLRWSGAVRALRGVVAGVIVVVGLATLLGLLDRVSWVFELADIFRLQYLVVLAGAALAAVLLRRPRLAGAAVVLAAVNAAVLGISLIPTATAASGTPAGSLRLVVANVEVGNTDFAAVRRLVARTHPDVFGVTELTPAMAAQLGPALRGYRGRVVETRHDAYGIGVYSRPPLLSARVVHLPADGPPSVIVRVRVAGEPVAVVATHVHTPFAGSIHVRQLQALAKARPAFGSHAAVCGDFNTPPWSGPLRDFASDGGLRDLYGGSAWAGYSWPTWSSLLRVPLDNCFVGKGIAVREHHDGPGDGSDHRPLVVDLAVLR
ncbi:MAG TPA: endonuclease/exonuclease/phosphatase family protein [Gaiellaceae bacterium]|nr:endonuclease/exonuclease/phosphatase family protein [Gaiellaceae bacterium]